MDNHLRVQPQGVTYRVYIGVDFGAAEPDWFHVDARGLSWREARGLLAGRLARWLKDDCPTCRADGTEAFNRLGEAEPGTEFEANVEGEDYLIKAESAAAVSYRAPATAPGGWVALGATDDGVQDSVSVDLQTGDVIREHHEWWTTPAELDA